MQREPKTVSDEARELIGRIHVEMIARCTCDVKSPELQYHDLGCTFRVLGDAAAFIERTVDAPTVTPEMVERVSRILWRGINWKNGIDTPNKQRLRDCAREALTAALSPAPEAKPHD